MANETNDPIIVAGVLYEKYMLMPVRVEDGVYVIDGPEIECLRPVIVGDRQDAPSQ